VTPRSSSGSEPDPEANEEEDLRSRSDVRRAQKVVEDALMDLARRLVELPERTLAKDELPESVLDVVMRARLVRDPAPRTRALRLVRIALRDADAEAVERSLEDVHQPRRGKAPTDPVTGWREKLVAGDEETLNELVREYPEADRQKLRNLVRNARRAAGASRTRSLAALDDAIRESIR
jgi:ribosome-associated protein